MTCTLMRAHFGVFVGCIDSSSLRCVTIITLCHPHHRHPPHAMLQYTQDGSHYDRVERLLRLYDPSYRPPQSSVKSMQGDGRGRILASQNSKVCCFRCASAVVVVVAMLLVYCCYCDAVVGVVGMLGCVLLVCWCCCWYTVVCSCCCLFMLCSCCWCCIGQR